MPSDTEQLAPERQAPKSGHMRNKTLQQKYGQKIRGRFAKIRAEARRAIVDRDVFGLDSRQPPDPGTEQLADDYDPARLTPSGFVPGESARNHDQFMQWLRAQQQAGVVDIVSRDQNVYIRDAAEAGVRWGEQQLRKMGEQVDSADLDTVFNAPVEGSTLRLLYQRNYSLLDGLTSDVANQISEVLTRGFAQGKGARTIASEIADRIDSVGRHRATLIARNEVQYAANQASLRRYRQMGVTEVRVIGSDPCQQCEDHVGETHAISDPPSFGFPPYHPQCVCTIVPVT